MSLQRARSRKLSCSDGALNLRQELIANHYKDQCTKSKDEAYTTNKSTGKEQRKGGRRKDAIATLPDIMNRFLKNSTGQSNRRRKDNLFSRMLSGSGGSGGNGGIPEHDNSYYLRCAVRKKDTERVIELVANENTDINGTNCRGITSLHEASIDGNFVCVKILVSYGADIDLQDCEGFTPLDYAVFGGNFECAAYLIDKGAVVDRIRDGQIVNQELFVSNKRSSFEYV